MKMYSEIESRWSESTIARLSSTWDHVVTIPACGEDEYLPSALSSVADCRVVKEGLRVLCVIVLNGNEAREKEFGLSNEKSRRWFRDNCELLHSGLEPQASCPQSILKWHQLDLLVIDRSQTPWLIPANQGVGLVRKIGADVALMLIAKGKIKCRWIHATDADARLPDDYFLQLNHLQSSPGGEKSRVSCCIYPYRHVADDNMPAADHQRFWPAVVSYEIWLRYYVAGLMWAGSNYAYSSVGSLLAFDVLCYAQIRGFPRRMAGEDFYFQNKLSKIGVMAQLQGSAIELLTRPSTRVPFGTGQGTIKIDLLNDKGDDYVVYHPQVFLFLKVFLEAVHVWFQSSNIETADKEELFISAFDEHFIDAGDNDFNSSDWLRKLFIQLRLFENIIAAEQRSKSIDGAVRQFNDWFDGFKVLKLIHKLRDELYGVLPIIDALEQAPFLRPEDLIEVDRQQEGWLAFMRSNSNF